MARTFVADVSNPAEAFPRLKRWADNNGYTVDGDATRGSFQGTPAGVAGVLLGEISGAYSVRGTSVMIQVNKDLPEGPVANALSKHGLRLVRAD